MINWVRGGLILVVLTLPSTKADSAVIINHGAVGLDFTLTDDDTNVAGNELSISRSSGWTHPTIGFVNQSGSASVSASSELMHLTFSGSDHNVPYGTYGAAGGAWQDILYLVDSPTPPQKVTLRFMVEGNLEAKFLSDHPWRAAGVAAGISVINNLQGEGIWAPNSGSLSARASLVGNGTTLFLGWSSYSFSEGAFQGIYEAPIFYNHSYGGYDFTVLAGVSVNTMTGSASGDFGSTFRLEGVYDVQGNRIESVRFDSGLQLDAVPEPSSVVLVAMGGVMLVGLRAARGRRR